MKNKIKIILFLIIISLSFFVSWISWVIDFIVVSMLYWAIFYLIIASFRKIKNNEYKIFHFKNFNWFFQEFLYRFYVFIIVLVTLIWSFCYYQNEISPAKMPIYTLTNWDKSVVFQAMSHIWSDNFYKKVTKNIEKYKNDWYVLYFEWVRPWTKENQEKFNKAIWVDFNPDLYKNFSKSYWLTYQDNNKLLNIVNKNDYNIDVSIDEIIWEYEKLKIEKNQSWRNYDNPIDLNSEILNSIALLNEKELAILRYVNKSFINVIIKSDSIQNSLSNNFSNKELFEIILNKRNEYLSDEIINSQDKKIIVTYWLLHFKWVFEILKQNDIKWRIEKIDYVNVIN